MAKTALQTTAQVLDTLRSFVAPKRCLVCLAEDTWLCTECLTSLPKPVLTCLGCGEEKQRGLTCSACKDEVTITGAITAGPYTNMALQRGIRWLKFKGVRDVARPLALTLIAQLPTIAPIPDLAAQAVLVPVPLHTRRQRQRGFNQSELLVQEISRLTHIPYSNILQRKRATQTQSHLPHHLRTQNIASAFQAHNAEEFPDSARLIILVDDITTTGATLESAAHTLRTALSEKIPIWAATVARG